MPDHTTALIERILQEGPIGMTTATRLLGTFRSGRPTHPSTLIRHHLHGVRSASGAIVRLEAIRVAGRLMTSRAAVIRFLAAQQDPAREPVPPMVERGSSAAAASRELDAQGI